MQNISIKAGTSASISITPKISGVPATDSQMAGVTIYVFFVYQFTNKIYKDPYILTPNNLTINLTANDTIEMLGNASENQRYEIQFAVKDASGNIIADGEETGIAINITRWEAGQWLHKNK